jgi:hypothetical protein
LGRAFCSEREVDDLSNAYGIGSSLSRDQLHDIAIQLEDPAQWIERRVESLTFLDDGSTRRRLSFDFIMRPEFKSIGFVPLAIFRKENLLNLDVTAADGQALSILTSIDAADLAARILRSGVIGNMTQEIQELIGEIVSFNTSATDKDVRASERELLAKYVALTDIEASKAYSVIASVLLRTFILWVKFPEGTKPYQRVIIKVSYEEASPFRGIFPPLPIRTVVHPNWSSRFHFEVTAPLELCIRYLTIGNYVIEDMNATTSPLGGPFTSQGTNPFDIYSEISDQPVQVAHVAMDGYKELPPMHAIVQIVPSSGGTTRIASMVTVVTMLVCLIPTVFKLFGSRLLEAPKDGTAAALLLLGPALLVAHLAKSPEHPIVAHRLRGARYSLLISGGLLMIAAGLLGGLPGEGKLRISWYVLTGLSAFACLVFFIWKSRLKNIFH